MKEIRQYGFKRNAVEDVRAYKLGNSPLSQEILNPSGQWDKYLPDSEVQRTPAYETFGCTIYGTENILQILENFHYEEKNEYSERYNYNIAGVNPPGHDPHDAAESFRLSGVIPYDDLPMTKTFAEYKTPRPVPAELISKGKNYALELKHQWLWTRSVKKEDRDVLFKHYLLRGPVAVSVTAWWEENGVFVDRGQPNTHWVVIYGWNDLGWKAFDSYAPHQKVISYDHNMECAKQYQLAARDPRIPLMKRIINLALKLIGLLKEQKPPVVPLPPMLPKPPSLREKIYTEAYSWLGKDASPSDKAPEELACAESVCNILQRVGVEIPLLISTTELNRWLDKSNLFKRTLEAKDGNIIISPTGLGSGAIPNGHVGIFAKEGIMSNDSYKKIWLKNYTLSDWAVRYRGKGGYPIYYYEAVV